MDYKDALSLLLGQWDALQLILRQDPDGSAQAAQKLTYLIQALYDYFDEYAQQYQLTGEDLREFYEGWFEDVFDVFVDDGSLDDVARWTCELWRECESGAAASGNGVVLDMLKKRQVEIDSRKQIRVAQIEPLFDQSPSPSEGDTSADVSVVAEQQGTTETQEPTKSMDVEPEVPLVDADGWERVPSRRRRR